MKPDSEGVWYSRGGYTALGLSFRGKLRFILSWRGHAQHHSGSPLGVFASSDVPNDDWIKGEAPTFEPLPTKSMVVYARSEFVTARWWMCDNDAGIFVANKRGEAYTCSAKCLTVLYHPDNDRKAERFIEDAKTPEIPF